MSSYFFIKLYHEVLHDPKMGRLTDDLWRRTIEIFLLAGEHAAARHLSTSQNDGLLPPVDDMSWTLRLSVEKLESDLAALEKYNITSKTIGGQWLVVNFAKRQAAIEGAERVAAHRDRSKKEQYYESETPLLNDSNESVTSRYTELDIDIDHSKKNKQNGAGKPRGGAKQAHNEAIDTLTKVFSQWTSIPCPNGNGVKGAAATRWYAPLNRMWILCQKDTTQTAGLIEKAIGRMREKKLTISAPQSIEKIANSIYGENGAAKSRNVAADWQKALKR